MATDAEYNRLINDKWEAAALPVPTPDNAIKGARQIYRKAMGKAWKGEVKITSGNRHTWIRRGVMSVNPNEDNLGWREIVHSMSHYAHMMKRPNERPHSDAQTILEAELTSYVLSDKFKKYHHPKEM